MWVHGQPWKVLAVIGRCTPICQWHLHVLWRVLPDWGCQVGLTFFIPSCLILLCICAGSMERSEIGKNDQVVFVPTHTHPTRQPQTDALAKYITRSRWGYAGDFSSTANENCNMSTPRRPNASKSNALDYSDSSDDDCLLSLL